MKSKVIVKENKVLLSDGSTLQQRVGELIMMEDGYYEFFPDLERGGYWPTWVLRGIADLVDEKNAEWDASIRECFDKHETPQEALQESFNHD